MESNLKALVIEDNQINQLLITRLLQRYSFDVKVAENGKVGVEAYKEGIFDLVLMDIQMPVMGGYEATRLIREYQETTGVRTPIVALTANAMKGDREKCLEAGMDEYLSKPVESEKLLATLKKFLPDLKRGKIE